MSDQESSFGSWGVEDGLPVFHETVSPTDPVCTWDPVLEPATNRHRAAFGNRRFQAIADNHGTLAIWDTATAYDWLTGELGTGVTTVASAAGSWATDLARWPDAWSTEPPTRTWGPTWSTVRGTCEGLGIERSTLAPDGDLPWLVVRVTVAASRAMTLTLGEEWRLRPSSVPLFGDQSTKPDGRSPHNVRSVGDGTRVRFVDETGAPLLSLVSYQPVTTIDGGVLRVELDLVAGESRTLWFAIGREDEVSPPADPKAEWTRSLEALRTRLPVASSRVAALHHEVPWHAAMLTGGACTDKVLGNHTLDQASAYSFRLGFNGAARDPLQHALPLVYSEPELALSVLRNTCTWAAPDGELPYALDARKQRMTDRYRPSDQALWSMWLASEYLAATGDVDAFTEALAFHPSFDAEPAALVEHLARQYRHLIDVVGVGVRGHIRMLNADWNDSALTLSPLPRDVMMNEGESVLNSAMAAWVLPRFAGCLRRVAAAGGDSSVLLALADDADRRADDWRDLVAGEWNGRWFHRAIGPGAVIGADDCWLEVQPWAILCGAATDEQGEQLLATIDATMRDDSPVGCRLRGPRPINVPSGRLAGEGTSGGIWYSINMTLAWAARELDPDLAWDELDRMTLGAHSKAYPGIWEGTISGPDSYNTPESSRPGATWAWPSSHVAMQSFPVTNLHAHAQVLLTYLRLLGVEPTADGSLRIGASDDRFASSTFALEGGGHGRLQSIGPVRVVTPHGAVDGAGRVTF